MPGLIGSQGVRPGALNMNRVFRALRYRTEQAQKVTYHRPAIYKTDAYGVPSGTIGSNELLIPDLPAIIRPAVTADYQQQRQGSNIIGAARIYTPNITTIKKYDNFNQNNNGDFNEIEGWDRLITNYRTVYSVFTSGNSNPNPEWVNTGGNTPISDGESILVSGNSTAVTYTTTGNKNVLEADRLRFKIKTNDNNVALTSVVITNTNGAQTLTYTPAALTLTQNTWLTVDLPFLSGTTSTSVYQGGTRYATTVAGTYDYEKDLASIKFNYTGPATNADIIYLKEVEFYKSVSWHVHSLKDMTDGYIIFDCVRTQGRNDSRRRAYDE
jgi:hypothetical protein|tara:strand:+ start:754 stop:1731 length:978 start_codon:yes stop_codon:yes gene_type:complete